MNVREVGPLAVCSIETRKCLFHKLNLVIVLIHTQYYCHTIEFDLCTGCAKFDLQSDDSNI